MHTMQAYPEGWQLARFDEVFRRVERRVTVDDSRAYDCVGVRWYGLGAFVRETRPGMSISRKQQWVIKSGDIVYNKLFAWKGAFAVADGAVDGCIVSDKFPTYEADPDLVDRRYLMYYFRTSGLALQAEALSRGAAAISKLTLNPPQFWQLTVALPILDEQKRIADRIEGLLARIEEAQELREATTKAIGSVFGSAVRRLCGRTEANGRLADVLLERPRNGWSPRCDNTETGTPVLSLSAVTGFHYQQTEFKRTSAPTARDAHYWLHPGDLLITRSNTPALVGHVAVYNGSPNPCIYPDLMMRLLVDTRKAERRFVHAWLRGPLVRQYIRQSAKGSSPTMKKITQRVVMDIPFATELPLSEQRRIVTYLDRLETKLDAVRRLQAGTSAELDALLPAVLDRAFRGEL